MLSVDVDDVVEDTVDVDRLCAKAVHSDRDPTDLSPDHNRCTPFGVPRRLSTAREASPMCL